MNLLLQQLAKATQGRDAIDNLVLLGCGRLKELSSLHTGLANRIFCIDASPRLEAANSAHIAALSNASYMNVCVATLPGEVAFYSFNFVAFDGLQSREQITEAPRNLVQLESTAMRAIGLAQLIEQMGLRRDQNNAILMDIGACGAQLIKDTLLEHLHQFSYIGIEHKEAVLNCLEIKGFYSYEKITKALGKSACGLYMRQDVTTIEEFRKKTLEEQLQYDILTMEWLMIKHAAEIEKMEESLKSKYGSIYQQIN